MKHIYILALLLFGYNSVGQELENSTIILESNLPIIVIDVGFQSIPDDPKISARMGIIENNSGGANILTKDYSNDTIIIGIERRGQSSQYFYPKKSYGLETRDENGDNLNIPLLGLPKENDWVLYGPYGDKTLIRNKLIYDLAGKLMDWAPNFVFCELVIDDNYKGLYLFGEKIKRDKNRVDIAKLKDEDIEGDELTGGYILKIDKGEQDYVTGWYSSYTPASVVSGNIYFQYHYPEHDDIQPEQKTYIRDYISAFEDALKGPNFKDADLGYQAYIDTDSFIDFFIINEFCKNIDGYRLSTFFYKDKDSDDGRLKMGPVWDFNLAFGNVQYCHGEKTSGWAYQINESCPDDDWLVPFWWDRLLEDNYFQDRLKTRWQELRTSTLRNDSIFNLIDSYVEYLGPVIGRNIAKWPIIGEWIWPNFFVGNSYQEEIDYMKDWIDNRLRFLDYYMPGKIIVGDEQMITYTDFKVFPNPVIDILIIDTPYPINISSILMIYDYSGKLIKSERINQMPARVSLGSLAKGLYVYEIKGSNKQNDARGTIIKN